MIRLVAILLCLVGCTRQINAGAAIPVYLASGDEVQAQMPQIVSPAGVVIERDGAPEVWIREDLTKSEFARVLSHELLGHLCRYAKPDEILRALDPGNGSWIRHARIQPTEPP